MKEYEIFSQYIGNDSELDSMFIKLSSNMEISITNIKPIMLTLTERLDMGSPSVVFDFVDGNGDLANLNLPQSDAVFYLDMGRSIINTKRLNLRLSKMMSVNSTGGSERLTYRMFFVHHCWDKFIGETKNRGWGEKNPSEVVEEIAKECGWERTLIANADANLLMIQPNWTNSEMIKWITESSTTDGGRPRYCGRVDGTFLFKSIQSMIKEQSDLAMKGDIPLLRMEGQDTTSQREPENQKNKDIPKYFTNYQINESHAETRLAGGGGVRSYTYDSHSDRFMIDTWDVSDVEGQQMSDWTATATELTKSNTFMYNGRGSENKQKALSKISAAVDDAVSLDISTEGSLEMRVGMMLEIMIPIPPSVGSTEPYNIMYSGFWMTAAVKHVVNFSKSNMSTSTNLIRSGHDSKQLSGSAKTKGGKFVRRET